MWKLAWRQVFRHRTRTLITGSAIGLAYGLFLFTSGINDGMYIKMLDAAEQSAGGAVLVHADGWWEAKANDLVVDDPAPIVQAARRITGVEEVIPRVTVEALLTSPDGTTGVQLRGIDPARERALQDPARHLTTGAFLAADDPRAIVLGKAIVDDLALRDGGRVVVVMTDRHGEMVSELFRLRGVLDTGSEMQDRASAYVHLAALQKALDLGAGVNQLGLIITGRPHVSARDELRAALGSASAGLELLTWEEAMPEMLGLIEMDDNMGTMMSLLIFFVVAFGIANTFMMGVLERIRELGLLAALGMTPGRIGGLVLRETLILAGLSIVLGFALAFAAHSYLAVHGLDYTDFVGGDFEVSGVLMEDLLIYSHLDVGGWITSTVVVLGIVMLSALYPAFRAMRLHPTDAMRTYE